MRQRATFVLLFLCIILPINIFSNEKDTPGLWPEDSCFIDVACNFMGVADNDTMYYSPGHNMNIPLNTLYYIGSTNCVYVLTDNQYILIQHPIYSRIQRTNFPNDTIFTPNDSFILQYLAEFNATIGYQDSIDNTFEDDIFEDDSHNIDYSHFHYLYKYITMYYEELPISLNRQRINKFIVQNGFKILLFNFLPSEIDLAVKYASQIKQVKPDESVKQWLKRHFAIDSIIQ